MNIVSNYPQVPLSPVNPATQTVRQENLAKDVIKQPTQAEPFPREPGIAKEHEAQRNQTKEPRQRLVASDAFQGYDTRLNAEAELGDSVVEEEQGQQQPPQQEQEDGQQGAAADGSDSREDEEERRQKEQEAQQEFQDQQIISELKARDQEVRAHEQAHSSVGGQYAGAPTYDYDTGPDNRQYAVAGEVRIDITPVPNDPRGTIQKMRQVRAAALAPADPSPQDLKVAAEANRMIVEAQGKIAKGEDGESRYSGGERNLTGLDGAQDRAPENEEDELYTEAVMAHRNQVISEAYRISSKPTISATQLSA